MTASIKRLASAVVTVSLTDAKTGHVESLTCTPEHPFFTVGGGWVEAGSLGIGTSIVSRAGPALSVTGLTWKRDTAKELSANSGVDGYVVYNLTVEGDHTFFVGTTAGGTWVHNFPCRVRHYTDADHLQGIRDAGSINPARGEPIGVDVEVGPDFGPVGTAQAETGAAYGGKYVEFSADSEEMFSTNVGPRATARIPTNEPLNLEGRDPAYGPAWWNIFGR